jgi:hypothetical protein
VETVVDRLQELQQVGVGLAFPALVETVKQQGLITGQRNQLTALLFRAAVRAEEYQAEHQHRQPEVLLLLVRLVVEAAAAKPLPQLTTTAHPVAHPAILLAAQQAPQAAHSQAQPEQIQ